MNINYPVTDRLNLSLKAQASYLTLKGTVDTLFYRRNAFAGNGNLYLGYRFDHEWRGGFNFQYYSPAITLQGTSSPYYYTSLSVSKTIAHKKLTIFGSISNPYQRFLDYKYTYNDPQFTETTVGKPFSVKLIL